ncbi:MAG TPA: hypothetical protein VGB18_09500, partial [Candidatus Thermoplasmatota archaeon]
MALLFLTLGSFPVHAQTAATGDPKVSDTVVTLQADQIKAPLNALSRISGLRENIITATYTTDEVQPCQDTGSVVKYTLDGSAPSGSTLTVPAACTRVPTELGETPDPNSGVYRAVLTPALLAAAPANAMVRFQLEIAVIAPPPDNITIDDNEGFFFNYRLDKSQGEVISRIPAPIPNSSILDAVTTDKKPAFSFVLRDDASEAPLDLTSIQLFIDNVDRSSAIDCVSDAGMFVVSCALGYQHLGTGFEFTEGIHEAIVRGDDLANNGFNESRTTFRFRVDTISPQVTNVTAQPNVFVTTANRPTTARGAAVTVRANVEDLNINTNATSALAYLTNTTLELESAQGTPMVFNTTTSKWEALNVQVPVDWPAQRFNVSAKVVGTDQAGHSTTAFSVGDQFTLDPDLPVINETAVGPFIRDVATPIKAKITDATTGVDPETVKIRYVNISGQFKNEPTSVTKINNQTFEAKMNRIGTTDEYTYTIPAPAPGAIITYVISAKDKAGGPAQTPTRTLIVDLSGPLMFEVGAREFRAAGPLPFVFLATDAGAGPDNATGKLFTSTGGSFTSVPLGYNAATGEFSANVTISVTDGATVQYYAEVKDKLGNVGGFRNQSSPGRTVVDLLAPTTATVTAPSTSSATPTFQVSWSATDALSGIDFYTVEARVNDGTPSIWTVLAPATEDLELDFCGEGGHKYEFRVSATDRAGNKAPMPANPQASTQLSGEGCPEQAVVAIVSPLAGSTHNAAGSGTMNARWTASATRSFTSSDDLIIGIRFSPDGKFWHPVADALENTGSFQVNVKELPNCTGCRIEITARTLTGASANATSGAFRIIGASDTVDLDGNGL